MKQKTPVTTTIASLSHDGRGIAHIDGKTVFIKRALPGETVTFLYTKKRSQFSEGEAVEILGASSERVKPPCPHFGVCAGCSLQHIGHEQQIAIKQHMVLQQFKQISEIEITPEQLLPPLTADQIGYRRKARLSVKYVKAKDKVLVGFHESNGRFIADMETCAILDVKVGLKLNMLSALITSLSIFDKIPQIEVGCGDTNTALIIRCLEEPNAQDQTLLEEFAKQNQFTIFLQPKGLNSIRPLNANSDNKLSYHLPYDLELNFAPQDFIQVNKAINEKMLAQALDILQLNNTDIVLDLFCGLGNFTLPLAKFAKQVIGVEGDPGLIERAKANAQKNNIENTEFYTADLTTDLTNANWMQNKFSKIVLDPPRTGALEIIQHIVNLKVPQILYISCNPATLARDAKELIAQGYQLHKIGILDMFPHTKHVETMAEFRLA